MAERARVVDVRSGDLQLLGQVGGEADDPRELVLDVAGRAPPPRGSRSITSGTLSNSPTRYGSSETGSTRRIRAHALDEDPQRPVGDADHLVDDRERCRSRRSRPSRASRPRSRCAVTSASIRSPATTSSISRTERSWPIASGVIECGEDDRLLQRQHRQLWRQAVDERRHRLDGRVVEAAHRRSISIWTRSPARAGGASGSSIRSMPCSSFAVARVASTSSPRSILRWNGP